MKEYKLYLDESGNFKSDLKEEKSPECIVGGWLTESNLSAGDLKNIIVECWKKHIHDWNDCTTDEIFKRINHSVTNRQKYPDVLPDVLADLFEKLEKGNAKFCIFSNKDKARIKDSNKTYLNILSGGVAFVLQRLALENKEDICLNIIIGKRRDTEKLNDEHKSMIGADDYSRIEEAVDNAKIRIPAIKNCKVNIKFEDDKTYAPLVVSDYISYYYFTHTYVDFGRATKVFNDGKPIIYILGDELQDSELYILRKERGYDSVLNLLCERVKNSAIWQENVNWLTAVFKENPQSLKKAFDGFNEKLRRYVTTERKFNDSNRLIDNACDIISDIEKLSQGLNREQKDVLDEIHASLYLFRVTVYSHQGNQRKQKEYLNKCKKRINSLPDTKEKAELNSIYYNRLVLFQNYSFDVFNADANCVEAEKQLERDGIYAREELGKLYGTHMQVKLSAFNMELIDYDEVRCLSEKAIKTLSAGNEKNRQYQYRADLEADCGNINQALEYFAKSAKVDSWEDIDSTTSDFLFYHLSRIGVSAVRNGEQKIVEKILKKCKEWEKNHDRKKNDNDIDILPQGLTLFNLALIRVKLGKKECAKRMLLIAEEAEKRNITFAPQLFAEIAVCKALTDINKEYICNKLDSLCHSAEIFIDETRDFYKDWHDKLLNGNDKDLERFAKTRLY